VTPAPRISWELNLEQRYPYGSVSPDPDRLEPLGFPPPWPDRPWIYSNVITSQNGIVAWTRRGPNDDPIRVTAGGDFTRPGRRADVQLMRYLRACADAVSVGAQTLRDQPGLAGTLGHAGSDLGEVLERFRMSHGLRRLPLQVIYTQSGDLDLDVRIFNTPGIERLYSGVTNRTPSDFCSFARNAIQSAGGAASSSWLKLEIPCGVTTSSFSDAGASLASALAILSEKLSLRRLPAMVTMV